MLSADDMANMMEIFIDCVYVCHQFVNFAYFLEMLVVSFFRTIMSFYSLLSEFIVLSNEHDLAYMVYRFVKLMEDCPLSQPIFHE